MLLDKAVPIQLRPGEVEHVVAIEQAGRRLLNWPGKADTAKHIAARKAVLKALQTHYGHGFREKVAARKALEAAAKEAGILAKR